MVKISEEAKKVRKSPKISKKKKTEASSPEKKKTKVMNGDQDSPPVKKKKTISKEESEVVTVQDHIETPPASDEEEKSGPESAGDFAKFRISENTVSLLNKKKIYYLFPVQIKTFDSVFDGQDVVVQARTGTGKTLSFALPLVEKLKQKTTGKFGRYPKVLVMTPTRELALQVFNDFDAITQNLRCLCVYGGTPYFPQEKAMRNGVDIIVGTPGRILDHINKGNLHLSEICHVVLDEVDQMLDMGFAPSVEEILQYAYTEDRPHPQTLLFSATCPPWVSKTASKYMKPENMAKIDLIGKDSMKTATTVQHLAVRCHYSQRANCIGDVVQVYSGKFGRAIIFTETKRDANELGLNDAVKVETQVLHGDIEQKQREITLKAFRDGSVKCLVATNVAARGIDIPEVDLVIQINPPKDIESYIHRSGRTGRAGRLGTCICFYKPNEEELLRRVERTAGIKFKRVAPPQPQDILQSSYEDTLKCLDSVPEEVCSKFLEQAEKLSEKYTGGAVEALAAALAHISGATSLSKRSLLNARENYTTWEFKCAFEVRGTGFFWSMIEKNFGADVKGKVSDMKMTKDRTGAVCDIPDELTSFITENWYDSNRVTMAKCESLPELNEPPPRQGGGGRGNFRSRDGFKGRRGGGGGFRGQRGDFRNGMKRKWSDRKY